MCRAHNGHGAGPGCANEAGAQCLRDATGFSTITPAHPMWDAIPRVPGYERARFQHVPTCDQCHGARREVTTSMDATHQGQDAPRRG
jgi:hypothetical protein